MPSVIRQGEMAGAWPDSLVNEKKTMANGARTFHLRICCPWTFYFRPERMLRVWLAADIIVSVDVEICPTFSLLAVVANFLTPRGVGTGTRCGWT
ncbi:hypothetical protein BaRGS_00035429, partial [Batillaria attramentaria]